MKSQVCLDCGVPIPVGGVEIEPKIWGVAREALRGKCSVLGGGHTQV